MTVRILLVDHQALMRECLRAILEESPGCEVVGEAHDGRDAVRRVRELQPDVVIIDVLMPELNGIEATRQIKARAPGVEVVGLSGHLDSRTVAEMLKAGASACLSKADSSSALREAISAALRGRRFLRDAIGALNAGRTPRGGSERGAPGFQQLGYREREVLQLVAEGRSSAEIAARLHLATSTVESHRRNLMRKLDLHSVAALTKFAIREGLTPLEVEV